MAQAVAAANVAQLSALDKWLLAARRALCGYPVRLAFAVRWRLVERRAARTNGAAADHVQELGGLGRGLAKGDAIAKQIEDSLVAASQSAVDQATSPAAFFDAGRVVFRRIAEIV